METVLYTIDLQKHFHAKLNPFSLRSQEIYAVNGVTLKLRKGKTLGLVGESGCGKTTVGRCIPQLYQPGGGHVLIDPPEEVIERVEPLVSELERLRGVEPDTPEHSRLEELRQEIGDIVRPYDVVAMKESRLRPLRKRVQIVFQDPWASLNPQMTVFDTISEGPREFGIVTSREMDGYVSDLLIRVGLQPDSMHRYPHEFSGGQRQRIGIARALSVKPEVIVCDEPVSALDVSVQAQVLNLLQDLQEEFELSYLFISHDLGVVRYMSDEIAVMYLGNIVEQAESDELFSSPSHPYTASLLEAIPRLDGDGAAGIKAIGGEPPSPIHLPNGCPFHPRCPRATDRCRRARPPWYRPSGSSRVWCHHPISETVAKTSKG